MARTTRKTKDTKEKQEEQKIPTKRRVIGYIFYLSCLTGLSLVFMLQMGLIGAPTNNSNQPLIQNPPQITTQTENNNDYNINKNANYSNDTSALPNNNLLIENNQNNPTDIIQEVLPNNISTENNIENYNNQQNTNNINNTQQTLNENYTLQENIVQNDYIDDIEKANQEQIEIEPIPETTL